MKSGDRLSGLLFHLVKARSLRDVTSEGQNSIRYSSIDPADGKVRRRLRSRFPIRQDENNLIRRACRIG